MFSFRKRLGTFEIIDILRREARGSFTIIRQALKDEQHKAGYKTPLQLPDVINNIRKQLT